MADYSIKIMNETGNIQTYSLFQEAPKVSRYRYQSAGAQSELLSQEAPKAQGIPVNQVFTNIYQAAPPIQNNGTALFKMHKTFSAVCGTSPAPLAIGHTVTGSAAESVNLTKGDVPGSKVFLTAPYNHPQWDDSETWTTSSPNAFAIVTDTNFEYPNENNIFVGLCPEREPDDDTDIVPTATFMAHPGEHYTIWPKVKYYITTGSFTAGTVIDVQTLGQTLEVDFETGLPDRAYIHNATDTFVPLPSG